MDSLDQQGKPVNQPAKRNQDQKAAAPQGKKGESQGKSEVEESGSVAQSDDVAPAKSKAQLRAERRAIQVGWTSSVSFKPYNLSFML